MAERIREVWGRVDGLFLAFVLMSVLSFGQMALGKVDAERNADRLEARAAATEETVRENRADAADLRVQSSILSRRVDQGRQQGRSLIRQVEGLGETPVVERSELPNSTTPPVAGGDDAQEVRLRLYVDDFVDRRLSNVEEVVTDTARTTAAVYLRDNVDQADPPTDAQLADALARTIAANPPPAGADGADGAPGQDGRDGVGSQGASGADGRSVSDAVLDDCDLVLTFSDNTRVRVGPVCGERGPAGKDGAPGADAPKITEISCQTTLPGAFSTTYTFSDGTSMEVSCSGSPLEPTPPTEETP